MTIFVIIHLAKMAPVSWNIARICVIISAAIFSRLGFCYQTYASFFPALVNWCWLNYQCVMVFREMRKSVMKKCIVSWFSWQRNWKRTRRCVMHSHRSYRWPMLLLETAINKYVISTLSVLLSTLWHVLNIHACLYAVSNGMVNVDLYKA